MLHHAPISSLGVWPLRLALTGAVSYFMIFTQRGISPRLLIFRDLVILIPLKRNPNQKSFCVLHFNKVRNLAEHTHDLWGRFYFSCIVELVQAECLQCKLLAFRPIDSALYLRDSDLF